MNQTVGLSDGLTVGRPTCPTRPPCPSCPTRPTRPSCPTRPTRPTCPSCPSRPTARLNIPSVLASNLVQRVRNLPEAAAFGRAHQLGEDVPVIQRDLLEAAQRGVAALVVALVEFVQSGDTKFLFFFRNGFQTLTPIGPEASPCAILICWIMR